MLIISTERKGRKMQNTESARRIIDIVEELGYQGDFCLEVYEDWKRVVYIVSRKEGDLPDGERQRMVLKDGTERVSVMYRGIEFYTFVDKEEAK